MYVKSKATKQWHALYVLLCSRAKDCKAIDSTVLAIQIFLAVINFVCGLWYCWSNKKKLYVHPKYDSSKTKS